MADDKYAPVGYAAGPYPLMAATVLVVALLAAIGFALHWRVP